MISRVSFLYLLLQFCKTIPLWPQPFPSPSCSHARNSRVAISSLLAAVRAGTHHYTNPPSGGHLCFPSHRWREDVRCFHCVQRLFSMVTFRRSLQMWLSPNRWSMHENSCRNSALTMCKGSNRINGAEKGRVLVQGATFQWLGDRIVVRVLVEMFHLSAPSRILFWHRSTPPSPPSAGSLTFRKYSPQSSFRRSAAPSN